MSGGKRQPGDVIGDYRLLKRSVEGQLTRTWEAEQISMQRSVMLEMLKAHAAADGRIVSSFLEDVRAKALVTHPGVGAVYEAVSNEEGTFFSRERLEGENLETLYNGGQKFTPVKIMSLLQQIAGGMVYLEDQGIATVDFALHHFVLTGKEQIRLMNLAVEGQRDPAVDQRAKLLLGELFEDMLTQGLPGATRVMSLCGIMRDETRKVPITWKQVADLCRQVKDQLEGNFQAPAPVAKEPVYDPKQRNKAKATLWAVIGGVVVIGGVIALMVSSKKPKVVEETEEELIPSKVVEIPAGSYQAGEFKVVVRESFEINKGEVTFLEYDEFLSDPEIARYRHPEQPDFKENHLPDDWETRWRAAVKGEEWDGRPLSLNCPVTGIDWWDAYAFAAWKGGRLPTLAEWVAAATMDGEPRNIAGWGEVLKTGDDLTGAGISGMAGSVREWIAEPEIDPDNPLAPKSLVAAGASFENPDKGIGARLWIDSRETRRGDLGFRIISEK